MWAVCQAGGEAAQPLWGTRLPQPLSQEGRGRCLALLAGCGGLSFNTPRSGAALAQGPGAHSPWATPDPGGSEVCGRRTLFGRMRPRRK